MNCPAMKFWRPGLLSLALVLVSQTALGGAASDAGKLRPPAAPGGFKQMVTAAFVIQTDVSSSYLTTLARQVYNAETRMYKLFKISHGFLKGNDPKSRLGKGLNIQGDLLSRSGYKPWIQVRVYKKFDDYADEWFDESNRMDSLINKTPIRKETPEQRAMRRITEGVPGAYYIRINDYDGKYMDRRIRGFVGSKAIDDVESEMLHEMGHLFLETYLFNFEGSPKKGQESQKRGTPAWIGEGVAQLFEVNWSQSHTSLKKRARYNALIYEAVKAGDSYPFDKFVNVTNAHNLKAVANNRLLSTINYAQSYSVMQYMVEKDWQRFLAFLENCRAYHLKKKRGQLGEIYRKQNQAFKEAFTIPIAEVEKYWSKHVRETMEARLKKHPEDYYWCGEYFLRKKDLATAEKRFKLAIEGAPQKGEGYLGMGRVALSTGRIPAAVENLSKAVRLSPKNEDIWYYHGVALTHAGKSEEAIASLEKAVSLYPLFHQAQSALGDAYYEKRDYKKAAHCYDMAFQLSKHPQYLLRQGHAQFFSREYREAMKNYAAFTNIYKRDAQGNFWYGMAAWRLGQKEYALKKLEEAVKLAPNNKLFRQGLAMAKKGETITFTREAKAPTKKANNEDGTKPKKKAPEEEEEE